MKKNLRIVSVAAAALLAVAPVAASVTTVNAASAPKTTQTDSNKAEVTVPGTIMLDRSNNSQFTLSLNSTQEASLLQQLKAPAGAKISNVVVKTVTAQNANGEFHQYFTFDVVNEKGETIKSSTGMTNAKFASQQGTPYFYDVAGNTVINNGSTVTINNIANGFTPSSLLKEINDKYAWKTSDASGSKAEMTTTASDVESQLVAQGLKRASNGDFDYPANGFNLKLTAKSENGNTASITVRINATVNYNAPAFVFDKAVYFNNNLTANGTTSGQLVLRDTKDAKVIVNGKLNDKAVTDAVTVYVQSAYNNTYAKTADDFVKHNIQKINPSNIHIDSSKVNASVAGMYPVTITATNPAGFTSKLVVYAIVMGPTQNVPAQYVNVDNAKVYNINGNVVTEDSSVKPLAKGAAVYAFDSVTVNGVKYTEINKKGSNQWVKASDLTATAPAPAVAASVSKTIMHNAYYYNKEGKRVGTDKATRYDSVTVAPKTTTINGKAYYQVVENGKAVDKYINAGNIDGTKRTLKHNAYVYKTSKKRANKVVLKKGDTVTTYGASYKFKNGKRYYKIGNNTDKTYVKVANFR